jgi:hypothetical protein
MDKLEQRVWPEERKLFEQFLRKAAHNSLRPFVADFRQQSGTTSAFQ